ncbi:MAG: sulfite exporter TauE/SafE family protein [Prosthecobacter sp.]|jgi:uncharacterized membrane protein YfcA|nr:sulfite exporter TauE/SafE family protein [Prosthecobacter sp.]
MSFVILLKCLSIGVIAGVIAALCGVGGGVVMVPAFVALLALPQKTAVATSLAIIIPTALMATAQNARHSLVDWKVAAVTALSASLFAWFGAEWMRAMSNAALTRIFGLVLLVFGLRMLWLGKA